MTTYARSLNNQTTLRYTCGACKTCRSMKRHRQITSMPVVAHAFEILPDLHGWLKAAYQQFGIQGQVVRAAVTNESGMAHIMVPHSSKVFGWESSGIKDSTLPGTTSSNAKDGYTGKVHQMKQRGSVALLPNPTTSKKSRWRIPVQVSVREQRNSHQLRSRLSLSRCLVQAVARSCGSGGVRVPQTVVAVARPSVCGGVRVPQVVDATQSKDALHRQLLSLATRAMRDARTKPLRTLWQSPPPPLAAASATSSAATTDRDIST